METEFVCYLHNMILLLGKNEQVETNTSLGENPDIDRAIVDMTSAS